MPCSELTRQLDAFMDGDLPAPAAQALEHHLLECPDCRAVHTAEVALRSSLRRLPVEGPHPDYYERAFAIARRQRRRNDPRRGAGTSGFLLAAVATLVIAIGVASFTGAPAARIPQVTLALETTNSVNLVFSTATAKMGARVSLALPEGIEVEGYPGRRTLDWSTDLRAGKNALRLPLRAHAAVDDELVARLRHGTGSREFHVRVRVI
jgi:anti-sigma factor RsiW